VFLEGGRENLKQKKGKSAPKQLVGKRKDCGHLPYFVSAVKAEIGSRGEGDDRRLKV
jgi:hypothetical protein